MSRVTRSLRAHPVVLATCAVVLVVVGAAAVAAWRALRVPDAVPVSQAVPEAPRLTPAGPGQTVYRIDASRSSVGYEVDEVLAGVRRTARGTTRGVAGDVLVDANDPAATKVGQVVVDVAQLTSDEALRDQRLQHDFLEAATYPLATFTPTGLTGVPAAIADGTDYPITVSGDLTVKATTSPVTLTGTARRSGDELHVRATSEVSLAQVGVGPISLLGFVSVDDEATLSFDLVAVDVAKATTPNAVAAPSPGQNVATGTAPAGGSAPSFAAAVQPVLEQRCASCHNPGGSGAQVWQLETAGDAAKVASGLGLVTSARFMPPWPASQEGVALAHSYRLDDAELAAITGWAAAGGPLDVDAATPVRAAESTVDGPRRDLVLPMAEPYTGSLDTRNDYRCFVLDPKLTEPTAVTGYAFEPDKPEIVHHALAFRVKASARTMLDQRDAADPGPGWQCYSGIGTGGAGLSPGGSDSVASQFMAWAPGQTPITFPEGSGMPVEPGDVFVIQVHYHFSHTTPPDQSRMVFQLADDPKGLDQVRYETYLAPAEIPCGPDESGPDCDRSRVIDQLAQEFGPQAPAIANGLHLVCGTTVEQVAQMRDGLTRVSCDHRVRQAGDVLAVFGHMHEIGRSFRMTLNPGTPREQVLLDIPTWSFDWQMNYQLAEPVALQRGDVIRVQCLWDRGLFKGATPRYVTWAEGTEDEMCYSALTTRLHDGS
ncbi:MAG: YceI family protein [Acidimicrobiales bacterium]